jgi:hypothetical protein
MSWYCHEKPWGFWHGLQAAALVPNNGVKFSAAGPYKDFLARSVDVVKPALEMHFSDPKFKSGKSPPFKPECIEDMDPLEQSRNLDCLLETPWQHHSNRFSVLNTWACSTHRGMTHDTSGFNESRHLRGLPLPKLIGLRSHECCLCHLTTPGLSWDESHTATNLALTCSMATYLGVPEHQGPSWFNGAVIDLNLVHVSISREWMRFMLLLF